MAKASRIPSTNVRYKDTYGSGVITVNGFELEVDKDGWIEAPATYEELLAPHGFVKENSLAHQTWAKAQAKK